MTGSKITQDNTRINPFTIPYMTPRRVTPFDLIRLEDYKPAIEEGMKTEDEEIKAITDNPEPPTFDNTLKALENAGDLLDRVSTVMGNLLSANTCDELEALAQEMMPAISEHANNILFNTRLFERIKTVYEAKPKLTEEEQTLLKKTYEGFLRRGVGLDEKKKQRLREISMQMSKVSLQFSQNVLKDTNKFCLQIKDKAELAGLPEHQLELAAQTAKEKGKEGWVFTLDATSFSPVLTYADNRKLRKKLFMAYNTIGTHKKNNNIELVSILVNLRQQYAKILGCKTYAELALKQRMAENVKTVEHFLDQLIFAYRPTALKELGEIRKLAKEIEGDKFILKPWDISYYAHKLQLKKFDVDAEMLRPYFELSKVKQGVFGLATTLYGITFKENRDIPVYHPDVKAYEVFDKDGTYLAVLYADFHPRESKKSGAWMTSFQEQYIKDDGTNVRPHVSITMNLTKPTKDKPSLLTLGEVSTFLHEFGHALHEIFSNCRFETLSGTNVYWDFVELPSQFMENYATEKDFLKTFAFHYQTQEPIPDELIDKVIASKNFNAAYACMRQVSFGLLDMAYYTLRTPFKADVIAFEKEAWRNAQLYSNKLKTCMSAQFQHIMTGGYAAGYYCYKWAEVLDADAFSLFKETGIFNRETAESFRSNILSKGATKHPKELYKNFRKREPSIKALLVRDGIK